MDIKLEEKTLTRFDKDADTCDKDALYSNFFDGFFGKFQDSFFYTFIIQFIIVTLMYINVGKGKYWKVLFYASIAGVLGSLLENVTVAVICLQSFKTKIFDYVPTFLICELFWIPCEYAIPYLNLIKMEAFSKGKLASYIKYTIIGLAIPFIVLRGLIGYERMKNGYLQNPAIHAYHGGAFFFMGVSDILCTICILYYVKKNNNQCSLTANINNYIKHSSYTILVTVDIVSAFLSFLNILTNVGPLSDIIPDNSVKPLHCLKCSFILILAADALIFKYGANVSSIHESSGNNSKTYGNGGADSTNNFSYKSNFNKSRTANFSSYSVNDITCSSSKTQNVMVSPYTFSSMDNDIYSRSPDSSFPFSQKSIIKNYTNMKSPSSPSGESDKTVKVYPNQNFGFLNQ